MVQVTVLSTNGEKRTLKTTAFVAGAASGATVAKALRKTKPAEQICSYKYKGQLLTVWGWKEGKAGTENKHELPPDADGVDAPLLFGDAVVTGSADFAEADYDAFYEEAFGGFEELGSEDEEDEEEVEEEEEANEEEEEDGDADEDDEEEEEEEDADDDCYDDGDENGGGSKRRAPRRRTIASSEYRRIDMGLRSKVKMPSPPGKRAPKWQTAAELEAEEYD